MAHNVVELHGCRIDMEQLPAPAPHPHERDADGNLVEPPAENDGSLSTVHRPPSAEVRGPFLFLGDAIACARAWNEESQPAEITVSPPAILVSETQPAPAEGDE